ncbi:MAG: SDR family NAD(P)-dependent oxidoreductase [Bacteroidales bacterium]|nr:SDR family NAD(P)-dependent oxidoreductase [Bacteroidales bacterium]
MKRLLITGASGFIGGFLVEEALNNGYEVYAGIRETSNLEYLKNNDIEFFTVDLSDKQAIKDLLMTPWKFDYIIHNAGLTKTCDKKLFDKVNLKNTQNLIEALHETDKIPSKFVFISSLAAYGPSRNGSAQIKLSDVPKPVSFYGESKLKTENYIKSLEKFPYLIFRPTGVYGPREKDYYVMYKSINSGLETYIGSKEQYISFIYVKDLAKLLIGSLKSEVVRKSYFVSDLKSYTAVEFNDIIKKELNKKTIKIIFPKLLIEMIAWVGEWFLCTLFKKTPTLNSDKYKDISQNNWTCDSNDLIADFNFKPEYDLKKGIHEAIQWYKKKGML